ncbi:MAG: LytTR family transcriptional regulator DNA-binding domain-containing protein [Ekhidna sp.]
MDLAEIRNREARKSIQVILFDETGAVLESDDTLIKIDTSNFNVYRDTMFCGMETMLADLPYQESISFDCVNTDIAGKTSHYDFLVTKVDEETNRFSWVIHDYGKQYNKIFELQQERNLAEIKAHKAERATLKLKEEKEAIDRLFQELQGNSSSSQYILVKSDNLLVNIDLNEILYFEAYGDYIKVHTPSKMYVTYNTMKSVEVSLPEKQFFRIHRSYIIRLDKIKNIEQLSVEISDKTLPIGKSYKAELVEKIGQL